MSVVSRLERDGLRRLGTKKSGFRYRAPSGRRVSQADRERIATLRIPPAWTAVAIAPSAKARIQAVGKDAAGRWQYLYHQAQAARREREKRERMVRFLRALPRMRLAVAEDMKRSGIPRERVMAGILTILATCFLRPGSASYVKENGSYGIATLRRKHVTVRGDVVKFDFVGKAGKRHVREIRHRKLAHLVRELVRYPGEVFKYRSEEGRIVDVRRDHINAYIREVMGERFSAKDFRTWAANLLCAAALARCEIPDAGKAARRRQVAAVLREVADVLGNTPAVCRESYVFDSVIRSWESGKVLGTRVKAGTAPGAWPARSLLRSERVLADLLGGRAA